MVRLTLALFILLNCSLAGATDFVRVRVFKNIPAVKLRGVNVEIRSAGYESIWRAPGFSELNASVRSGKWRIESVDAPITARVDGSHLIIRGVFLEVGNRRVNDEVHLYKRDSGRVDVVVPIEIEEYLAGVIPSEMPIAWPVEALKAQTVAARSFVLDRARERRSKHFDVEPTIVDQVHRFTHEHDLSANKRAKLARVLKDTKGMVLHDSQGRVLRAFYSADCGCTSEDPRFVWGGTGEFVSVEDPSCKVRSPREWTLALDRQELRRLLIEELKLPGNSAIRALHVAGRTPSGRVAGVVAAIHNGKRSVAQKISAQDFRRIIGFTRVRSTDFSLDWTPDQLVIRGRGIGHGVGLCQTGAKALAESGMNFKEILKTYYPRATLSRRPQ